MAREDPIQALLVEDHAPDARLIQEELADAGDPRVNVTWAQTLKEGLTQLTENPPDLVLLDLSLPDSTGLDTVQRAHEAAPNVPIIVLTGLEDKQMGTKAVRAGAQDYLVKGHVDGDGLTRSITYAMERHAAQQELDELRRRVAMNDKVAALGAVVSGIGQEIRTATSQISNAIYQMRTRIEDAARKHPELTDIVEQIADDSTDAIDGVNRIEELVRELRRFTHTGSETQSVESLHVPVQEAIDLFRRTRSGRISIDAELTETPGVRMNQDQIEQVVGNLLSNAADAMQEGGTIRVTVTPSGDQAHVSVEDEGPGISHYDSERMFEPFYTTKDDAAGLGLPVARRIVETHGGELTWTTEEGKGSRFTVSLPTIDTASE